MENEQTEQTPLTMALLILKKELREPNKNDNRVFKHIRVDSHVMCKSRYYFLKTHSITMIPGHPSCVPILTPLVADSTAAAILRFSLRLSSTGHV